MLWDEFVSIANVEFDNKSRYQEVAYDLVIVGNDWWLERFEYNGCEWWTFRKLPVRIGNEKFITLVGYNESLEILNS